MKSSIVSMALALALAVSVFAQSPGPRGSRNSGGGDASAGTSAASAPTQGSDGTASSTTAQPARSDPKVFQSSSVLPAPSTPSELGPATIALPTEPIEPYLLTKDAGPFMVSAHVFLGPDATRYALALVLELRRDYQLPAWIYYQKNQPLHSNIRNVPPTAPESIRQPDLAMPERVRIYDEAAVLVGNCKTLDESEALLHRVKKIHPKCLDGMPTLMPWRKGIGLSRAMRTTNPYVPTQVLYPRKPDTIVKQMNSGPMSIFNCPGRYTLQVAEFTGRSTLASKDRTFVNLTSLKSSPLMTAADDAQKLADNLARDPAVMRTGFRPYVYHDRYSSKVTIGAFNTPNDPAAAALRQKLTELAVDLNNRKVSEVIIVPAPVLMDLKELPPH